MTPRGAHRRTIDASGLLLPVLGLAFVVLLWQGAVTTFRIPTLLMPGPAEVLSSMRSNEGLLLEGAIATGLRILIGFAVSVCLALPLAVVVVQVPRLGQVLQPVITLSQAVPKLVLAPLVVVWLGNGFGSQTAFAALVAFFPIFIEAMIGLRSIEPEMLLLARSMGSSLAQTLLLFRLPRALPHMFAGLKVGATLAVVGAIIGEWIGGQDGIGLVLLQADAVLDTTLAVAAIVVLIGMGGAFYALIAILEIAMMPGGMSRREIITGSM